MKLNQTKPSDSITLSCHILNNYHKCLLEKLRKSHNKTAAQISVKWKRLVKQAATVQFLALAAKLRRLVVKSLTTPSFWVKQPDSLLHVCVRSVLNGHSFAGADTIACTLSVNLQGKELGSKSTSLSSGFSIVTKAVRYRLLLYFT